MRSAKWQNRPLDAVYRVVFLDALRSPFATRGWSKTRRSMSRWPTMPDGEKDVLGLWIEQTEGAKFWLKVVNELKARGVNDILIAVVDGLKVFPEFEAEWGKRYPAIGQAWRNVWEDVVPFFAFAPSIKKMIYTTNAVEALHRSLPKIIKTRGSFPTDEAALKLLYLTAMACFLFTQTKLACSRWQQRLVSAFPALSWLMYWPCASCFRHRRPRGASRRCCYSAGSAWRAAARSPDCSMITRLLRAGLCCRRRRQSSQSPSDRRSGRAAALSRRLCLTATPDRPFSRSGRRLSRQCGTYLHAASKLHLCT